MLVSAGRPPAEGAAARPHDAVVVVPGIMGSALRDTRTGRLLWGMSDLRWYLKAWAYPGGLHALHVTDEERDGRLGRIEPAGLLEFPAWAPWLAGLEPYTRLVRELEAAVVAPEAVLKFSYDWRLPVEHNSRLLAEAATRHLRRWRATEAHVEARRRHPDGRPAQLVLIAHSMGGLLVQALTLIPGATDDVRTTITLGTPFYGAVKAASILNSGRGAPVPLPRRRLRALAATLPGLHDLLPTYRCLHEGTSAKPLTPAHVAAIGGDEDLAARSADFHRRVNHAALVGHHSLIGTRQRTMQGLRIDAGVVEPLYYTFTHGPGNTLTTKDFQGDGTVHWESAAMVEGHHEVVQQHGALPATVEATSLVRTLLAAPGRRPQPLLGDGGVGMAPPDVIEPAREFTFPVSDIAATCAVYEISGDRPGAQLAATKPQWRDGVPHVRLTVPRPGIYRLSLQLGARSPVTQLIMAAG